jgi:ATP-dependent helicase/nuclease subunit B
MVDTYFDITPYLNAIARDQLILTANNRLRNHMLRAYGQWQASNNIQVWPTPRIYSLSQWLESRWEMLQRRAYAPAAQRIISNLQRQTLWEKIIGESSLAQALLQAEPLAQAADSALRNLELWQLTEEDVRSADPILNIQSNSYCWLTWLGDFRARLSKLGFITQETANQILINAFKQGELTQEATLYLTGFDDIPPQHQDLINSACHELVTIKPLDNASHLQRTELNNTEQEMRAAALWSKQQLEQNPAAMIGIIVPNLGQCRDQVERVFVEVFEPLAALPDQPRYTLPFNFSAGTPLATTPIIDATLDLLELQKSSWELESLCNLLLSPFFGDADTELVLRAHLIQTLRKQGKFTIRLSDLRYHCQKLSGALAIPANETHLATRLVQLENYRRQSFGFHSAEYWCDFFQQHLQLLGWPGTRRLDSQEYQQLTLWNQVLDNFLQLDATGINFSYSNAIQQLRSIAGKTPFQAQTPNSPIQILGALEGAGLQFSHCWVMGLHHRQWPPVPAPNPLLPSNLQRTKKMPHASAERELEFARALTAHYQQCAAQVIFSSAHSDDDSELSPSALIRHLPLTAPAQLIHTHTTASAENYSLLTHSKQWELVDCASAPLLDITKEPVRGGANLFKEQAACPFNAFARLRLGATRTEEPLAGFSPIERGNLLHDALATVWRDLKNQAALIALDETSLGSLINNAAQQTVDALKQKRGTSIGAYYAQLEQERLSELLAEWLAQEKTRPPFSVIAIEEEVQITFAGLPLKLRIDRIDELANGELLLIDYKTGQPKAASWQGERMDEPQLPLYAVTASSEIAAIAFAQINAKAMQWIGTGELHVAHDGIFPSKQSWHEQLQEWQHHLQQLAQDFIQGDARVDMKNPTTGQYTEDLLPLNRLLEADALAAFIQRQQGTV